MKGCVPPGLEKSRRGAARQRVVMIAKTCRAAHARVDVVVTRRHVRPHRIT